MTIKKNFFSLIISVILHELLNGLMLINGSSELARLIRAGREETVHAYVSRVNFKMENK